MKEIYAYPVLPGCFKLGRGGAGRKRMNSHSGKLLNGYRCDSDRLVCIPVPAEHAVIIEKDVRSWLKERGFSVVPLEIRASRASEREREQRTGRKRIATEIHDMNGRAWGDIVAMLKQQVATEVVKRNNRESLTPSSGAGGCFSMSREEKQTTDRGRMPVTLDGIEYPSARQAFMALGLSQAQRREPRKELRRTGKLEITLAGRTRVIKRCEP